MYVYSRYDGYGSIQRKRNDDTNNLFPLLAIFKNVEWFIPSFEVIRPFLIYQYDKWIMSMIYMI